MSDRSDFRRRQLRGRVEIPMDEVVVRRLPPSEGLPKPPPLSLDDEVIVRQFLARVGWGNAEIEDIMDGPPFYLGEGSYRVRVPDGAPSADDDRDSEGKDG